VQHRRSGPGHALHHDETQRFSRHVDAVAQRIRSKQGRARIVAEDVDERPRIDRIHVLREQRQSGPREPVGDSRVNSLQPLDGRE